MGIVSRFFGPPPFRRILEHTKKVHECVELVKPLTDALIAEDYEKIKELHNVMSKAEYEADIIKNRIRDDLSRYHIMSVSKDFLEQFVKLQDAIADAAEDYCVVLFIRKTKIHQDLRRDFSDFVAQVIKVSAMLLDVAEDLSDLVESAFTGEEAERIKQKIDRISHEEWQADRLQRHFALHVYAIERELDPVTLSFYDKYCTTLSNLANSAESAAKFLYRIIGS